MRADHVQVPAVARIERQRQPVVAAARDVPVAHVAQPVVHALAHVGRRPLDGRVRVEQRLAQLVDRDEPVVGDAEDERRVAAPAMRIAVLVEARLDEQSALGEVADDLVGRVGRREPVQPAVLVVEASRLVDGRRAPRARARGESSKSSPPHPGAMWTMPVPSSRETSSQGITRCSTAAAGRRACRTARVPQSDELLAAHGAHERLAPGSGRPPPTRRSRAGRTRRRG